jgi:precorrin-2 methylase
VNASADWPAKRATDIFIVGTGIQSVRHLTLEAVDAMRACTTVFTIDHGFGIAEFIAELGPEVVDLIPEYKPGLHRLVTYQRMAARVVERALTNPPVTLAVYGHPSWLVFPAELIMDAAKHLGLNARILPGISCIDTIAVELGLDPAARGLQIHEATGLVLYERQLDPNVPCILLQVDAYRLETFTLEKKDPARLTGLLDYLLAFYPAWHQVESIYSSTHPLIEPIRRTFPLEQLVDVYQEPGFSGSIFIPPVAREEMDDAS